MSRMRTALVLAVLAGIIGAAPAAAQDADGEPAIRISNLDIDRYPIGDHGHRRCQHGRDA